MRDRVFARVPRRWLDAYEAGVFTEFMEQRAPGHTALDGEIYRKGMLDYKVEIASRMARLDWKDDPEAGRRLEQLQAMDVACDAAIIFAERHAARADERAAEEEDPTRRAELERIAQVCRWVPAHAPRDFREAIQMYWFVHLATITELNGWDAMNPGHLDQHLRPFYERGLADGTLDRDCAKELLEALWIKFNNHPAPPKVGVTAQESGTYNDFTNINLAGLTADGADAVSDLSYLLLEVLDEVRLLQPQANVQLSARTPDRFLKAACRVIRKGFGYPSLFNADTVIAEQVRAGKRVDDAREGGTSGCIETGTFGKEAYILTGYLNVPKILEVALNDGVDPASGKQLGPKTGAAQSFASFEDVYEAFRTQLELLRRREGGGQPVHRVHVRPLCARAVPVRGDPRLHRERPGLQRRRRALQHELHPVLRHRHHHGQPVRHPAPTSSTTAAWTWPGCWMRCAVTSRTTSRCASSCSTARPSTATTTTAPTTLMQRIYESLFDAIDGRPNTRGGRYHLNMLSTTAHVYFGTPRRRHARRPPRALRPSPTAPRPPTAPTATGPRRCASPWARWTR